MCWLLARLLQCTVAIVLIFNAPKQPSLRELRWLLMMPSDPRHNSMHPVTLFRLHPYPPSNGPPSQQYAPSHRPVPGNARAPMQQYAPSNRPHPPSDYAAASRQPSQTLTQPPRSEHRLLFWQTSQLYLMGRLAHPHPLLLPLPSLPLLPRMPCTVLQGCRTLPRVIPEVTMFCRASLRVLGPPS